MGKLLAYQPAALGLAILKNERATINTLIQHPRFDVNAKTVAGYSPLYYAVKASDLYLVEDLIRKGAKVDGLYNGLSLRDIAQQQMAINNEYGLRDNRAKLIDAELAKHNITFDQKKLETYSEQIKPLDKDTTQNWILNPMKRAGYKIDEGYCYGVSHVGVQALLIEERNPATGELVELERFDARMDRMQHFRSSSVDNASDVKEKRILLLELAKSEFDTEFKLKDTQNIDIQKLESKLRELNLYTSDQTLNLNQQKRLWLDWKVDSGLTDYERIDAELPSFYDTVELYHKAYEHKEILETNNQTNTNTQSAVPVISMLTPAKIAEKGGMYIADKFTGVYDNDELTGLLEEIKQLSLINNYKSPIALQMSGNRHAITVGYDPVLKNWSIIDANGTKRGSYQSTEFASKMLRDALLVHNPKEKLLVRTNIFCTGHQANHLQEKILKPLRASNAWKQAHTITQERIDFKDRNNYTLKEAAHSNGDLKTLRQIIDYNNKQKSLFGRFATFITGGLIKIRGYSNAKDTHRAKSKPFEKALTQFKDVPQHDPVFNADTIKKSKAKIIIPQPPMSPTTIIVHKKLSNGVGSDLRTSLTNSQEMPTVSGEIDPILKQSFDADDPGKLSQFTKAFLPLEKNIAMDLLLRYQSEKDISNIHTHWRMIRDAHPDSSQGVQANNQLRVLEAAQMLMRPFDLRREGLRERVEFRNAFLALPTELKEVVLERYQSPEHLTALKENINKCIGLETKTENIQLIEDMLAKKIKNDPVYQDVEDTPKVAFGQSQRTPS